MSWRRQAVLSMAMALGLMLCVLALWAVGHDAGAALTALVRGAFGDSRRLGITLLRATPLLLTGLGVALAFRAGLWNIGAEGQMLVGAVAAIGCATRTPLGSWWLAPVILLLVGGAAGAVWGALAGALRAGRDVPEVISTIMLNFVAIELVSWVVQGPLQESAGRYPQTDSVPVHAALGPLGIVPTGLVVGVGAALLLSLLLSRTRVGLEVRVCGSNRLAAEVAGVRVRLQAVWVFALSGAIAGLAGGAEVLGSIHRLYEGYAPGYGYTAIAVAMLARLSPLAVVPSALFFGALQAGAETMERQAGVPAVVSSAIQAVVILAAVYAWRRGDDG